MKYIALVLALVFCSSAFAATVQIYPNGTAEVTVPAAQYISVFSGNGSTAKVYKKAGYANIPESWALEASGAVLNKETVFGPYTYATTIRIEAGPAGAMYSVGALAAAKPCVIVEPTVIAKAQLAPVTYNTTSTLLGADLMKGLITSTHTIGHTVEVTLPTGTLLDAASGLAIDTGFEWVLINLSAAAVDTITLVAGSTHTIVGSAIVQSQHSSTGGIYGATGRFFTRKTAANTFVTYRIN
jgi:hypothetical protein